MVGRTAPDAAREFRESLQRSLDCAVEGRLNIDGYQPSKPSDEPYTADVERGKPIPFAGRPDLLLVVIIKYRLVEGADSGGGSWLADVVKYEYAIENQAGREVLAYHLHPDARNSLLWPHLHIGSAVLSDGYKHLSKTHIRTEPIPLEDVLWYALHEL